MSDRAGYFAAHRKLFDPKDRFWGGEVMCRKAAWLDLISMAGWEGPDRGVVQCSTRYLATRWRWSRARVIRFLRALENRGSLVSKNESTNRTTSETSYLVVKYDEYNAPRTTNRTTNRTKLKNRRSKEDISLFEDAFERVWKRWLDAKRKGGNPKAPGRRAWLARCKAGVPVAELERATMNYLDWCEREDKVGTPYIMQASTFYGPSERWKEHLTPTLSAKQEQQDELRLRREREADAAQDRARRVEQERIADEQKNREMFEWFANLAPNEKARIRLRAEADAKQMGIDQPSWIKVRVHAIIAEEFAVSQHAI